MPLAVRLRYDCTSGDNDVISSYRMNVYASCFFPAKMWSKLCEMFCYCSISLSR